MISTSDFKKGMIIKYENAPWKILDYSFYKPGKGGAFMQTKLQNLKTKTIKDVSFKSQDRFEELEVEKKPAIYIYHNNKEIVFNDKDTNKRFSLPINFIGEKAKFLKNNMEVTIEYIEEEPLEIELPIKINYLVKEAPPAIKGNTATGGTKNVILENGLEITVPLFIKEGDVISVNTEKQEYVERVNK